jgi:hypothetical protein
MGNSNCFRTKKETKFIVSFANARNELFEYYHPEDKLGERISTQLGDAIILGFNFSFSNSSGSSPIFAIFSKFPI